MGNTCCNRSAVTDDQAGTIGNPNAHPGSFYNPTLIHSKAASSAFSLTEYNKMPDGFKVSEKVLNLETYLQTDSYFQKISSDTSADTGIKHVNKFWEYKSKDIEKSGVYFGQFDGPGHREGKGRMIWNDGSVYNGQWKADKASGWGYLILSSGDYYIGRWRNDLAHGEGRYHHADGSEYVGNWLDDKQNGIGTETWPDGSVYKGSYKDSKKHGAGEFTWGDGSMYNGHFNENRLEGKGVYKWADGRKYDGDWVNNHMHGKGIFTWPDGRLYDGEFKNDKKDGEGKFYWDPSKTRSFEGNWSDGKQNGPGIYREGNEVYKGIWTNGDVKWPDDKKPPNNPKNRK